ncbi:SDR family NAD(P)-dependent oxidoreductase [Nocardioides sp. LHG3406-4]|uniref:SDR family NAD(P)-dependent oxidoreductase n=1 Tax=Nocardioides sp. LHG3406-4 TaxID=2804575 RepID=UPI003CEC26F5
MTIPSTGTALITGATAGLGAAYADLLAQRGLDLVLVARDKSRLDDAASALVAKTGRTIDVLAADLTTREGIRAVEDRILGDGNLNFLVNNAGDGLFGPLSAADPDTLERLVALNVSAFTRIAAAAAKAFVDRGEAAIVNIGSALALNIMPISAAYSATKSYVITFTQGLAQEFADSPVQVQAVLPGGLATGFWNGSGLELDQLPSEIIMAPADAAAAGLAGLDAGELITIPSLPDAGDWAAYDAAREALIPRLSLATPAPRYQS